MFYNPSMGINELNELESKVKYATFHHNQDHFNIFSILNFISIISGIFYK